MNQGQFELGVGVVFDDVSDFFERHFDLNFGPTSLELKSIDLFASEEMSAFLNARVGAHLDVPIKAGDKIGVIELQPGTINDDGSIGFGARSDVYENPIDSNGKFPLKLGLKFLVGVEVSADLSGDVLDILGSTSLRVSGGLQAGANLTIGDNQGSYETGAAAGIEFNSSGAAIFGDGKVNYSMDNSKEFVGVNVGGEVKYQLPLDHWVKSSMNTILPPTNPRSWEQMSRWRFGGELSGRQSFYYGGKANAYRVLNNNGYSSSNYLIWSESQKFFHDGPLDSVHVYGDGSIEANYTDGSFVSVFPPDSGTPLSAMIYSGDENIQQLHYSNGKIETYVFDRNIVHVEHNELHPAERVVRTYDRDEYVKQNFRNYEEHGEPEKFFDRHCFAEGTLVKLGSGSWCRIEDLKIGDCVAAFFEGDVEDFYVQSVTALHSRVASETIDFHGTVVTPGHRFLGEDQTFKEIGVILAEDGAVVLEDGVVVRARTKYPVGSPEDRIVTVGYDDPKTGETVRVPMRAGVPFGMKDGAPVTLLAFMKMQGYELGSDGLFVNIDGETAMPYWDWGVPPDQFIAERPVSFA